MAKIVGRLKNVGIALEASRGAGASPTYWLPKTSFSMDDKVVKARNKSSYGNLNMEGNQAIVAKAWAEGDIEAEVFSDSFGVILKALFGAVSSASVVDSSYTHTFSVTEINQHPSLAISVEDGSIAEYMFRLAMINSLEISFEPEDIVKMTMNVMSKRGVGTAQTATYTAQSKFVGRDLVLKVASLTSGLNAATALSVKKLTLNFEKNTRLDHNLGTVEPEDIQNQAMRISGEIELDYEDRSYRDLMMNGSYRAMRIQCINARDTIGGGTTNPQFKFDFSRCDFDGWEPAYPNDEIASQKITFTALHDITNNNTINSCTLTNAVASY